MKGGELKIEDELNKIMGDMKINSDKFESFVKTSNENILVIVYAHWCYHCVNMIKHIGKI